MKDLEFGVDESLAGQRLDSAIHAKNPDITRSRAKNLIEGGHVLVDGAVAAKAGLVLRAGQVVRVSIPEARKLDLTPQEVGITLLFEDEHLAVLKKPAGISVHPSTTESGPTVVHGLLWALNSLSKIGGVERPGIVHRIDKGTSGVLVVSKTDLAHQGLSQLFKTHTIDRKYLALVYGVPKTEKGTIETLFGRHPLHRKKMTGNVKRGKKATTHWSVREKLGPLALIECRLETGRTHQIRAHMSEMGHPLVGDPVYVDNARRAKGLKERNLGAACEELTHQLLHAYHLGFEHPVTKQKLSFDSDVPEDFQKILELARGLEFKSGKK